MAERGSVPLGQYWQDSNFYLSIRVKDILTSWLMWNLQVPLKIMILFTFLEEL